MGPKVWFTLWTASIVFVVFFLLGYSLDTVPPTHMGLLYNNNTNELMIDEGLYNHDFEGSGRYFVGLGKQFILFPRTIQDLVFSST
jgi:hypothetical protein